VLDACLQAAVFWLWKMTGKGSLPMSCQRLDIFASIPNQVFVYAKALAVNDQQATLDILIYSPSGELCARLKAAELTTYLSKPFPHEDLTRMC
jgi:hypothetical protein